MKKFKEFLREQEDETTYAGFTVNTKQPEWTKTRTDVAGYYGNSTNTPNSDPDQEGTVTVNNSAKVWEKNPQGKEGLKKIEAIRGIYSLEPDTLDSAPDLTDEQDKNLNFYTDDQKNLTPDEAKRTRKQTFYSRAGVGDRTNPKGDKDPELSADQWTHVRDLNAKLNDKGWYGKHKAGKLESLPNSASGMDRLA